MGTRNHLWPWVFLESDAHLDEIFHGDGLAGRDAAAVAHSLGVARGDALGARLLPHDAVHVDGGEEGHARRQVGHPQPATARCRSVKMTPSHLSLSHSGNLLVILSDSGLLPLSLSISPSAAICTYYTGALL